MERFDKIILRDTTLKDTISFADCILVRADLADVNLRKVDLNDAYLWRANLTDADIKGADLTAVDLRFADLTGADLRGADLTNSFLWGADLTKADLWRADLTDVDLQQANLTGATLSEADLTGAGIIHTELDLIEIDGDTTFGGRSQWEVRADKDAMAAIPYLPWRVTHLRALGRPSTSSINLDQAELQYRATRRILRENDLRQLPELDVREKHARRKRMLAEHKPLRWFKLAGSRWIARYGEGPWNVVFTSLVVIGIGVIIYPHTGLDGLSWFDRLYFSAATFTPLMQAEGLPAPETQLTKMVPMAQALLGVALTALLVAVLDRRITR